MTDPAITAAYAAAAADLTKDFTKKLVEQGGRIWRDNIASHFIDFDEYVSATAHRCSIVKTIIDRSRALEFDEIYVKSKYNLNGTQISDDDLCQIVRDNKRVVVEGFGGIGKTMLMKYLWLSIARNPQGRLPVFVELRRLNDLAEPDLLTYIRASLSPSGQTLGETQFLNLMKDGRFVFLLDAFDELNDERRDDVERQVLKISSSFPMAGFTVTSRHNDRFESWEQFSVAKVMPFDKSQIVSVIEKVPFDKKVKSKFLSEVIKRRFSQYETFLTTPLLALMMLMTYDQFSDIPERMHLFYKYAFQTLYMLHDSGKESFSRKRKSGLDEDGFCRLLSTVCLSSYISEQYSFKREQIIEHINKASSMCSIKIDAVSYLAELCESVNILYQEGDEYSFVHRSFQEYFAALSITSHLSTHADKIIDRLPRAPGDSILMMAYEMNSSLIEESYLSPKYELFKTDFAKYLDRKTDINSILIGLGAHIVLLSVAQGGQDVFVQCNFRSDLSEFVRRAIALTPREHPDAPADEGMRVRTSNELKQLVEQIYAWAECAEARQTKLIMIDFHANIVVVDGASDTKRIQHDMSKELLDMLTGFPIVVGILGEHIASERARIVTVERVMRKVKGRSKVKNASLEEILALGS